MSPVRLRPERRNHVWAYDFVEVRTNNGRSVRLLTIIDVYTRECLAILPQRSIRSSDVIETLVEFMTARVCPSTFARATDRSSPPGQSGNGWAELEPVRYTSSLGLPGKTVTWGVSTASCGTNCWTGRCSAHCWRCRCSLSGTGRPTIASDPTVPRATGLRSRRPYCPRLLSR